MQPNGRSCLFWGFRILVEVGKGVMIKMPTVNKCLPASGQRIGQRKLSKGDVWSTERP